MDRRVLIETPKGKALSGRQYLHLKALADERDREHACREGHFACAAWEEGPCSAEIAAILDPTGEEGL